MIVIAQALQQLKANSELKPIYETCTLHVLEKSNLASRGPSSITCRFLSRKHFKRFKLFNLIRELEQKFFGRHVMLIAERKILPKPKLVALLKRIQIAIEDGKNQKHSNQLCSRENQVYLHSQSCWFK